MTQMRNIQNIGANIALTIPSSNDINYDWNNTYNTSIKIPQLLFEDSIVGESVYKIIYEYENKQINNNVADKDLNYIEVVLIFPEIKRADKPEYTFILNPFNKTNA